MRFPICSTVVIGALAHNSGLTKAFTSCHCSHFEQLLPPSLSLSLLFLPCVEEFYLFLHIPPNRIDGQFKDGQFKYVRPSLNDTRLGVIGALRQRGQEAAEEWDRTDSCILFEFPRSKGYPGTSSSVLTGKCILTPLMVTKMESCFLASIQQFACDIYLGRPEHGALF